jgi:hypothetical protein
MSSFHIHRLKDHLRPSFRSAPHVSGTALVKPRDYEPGETVEAGSPYAAFFALRDSEQVRWIRGGGVGAARAEDRS